MADTPARRGYDPAREESGWGSPMPVEYGSLAAFLPPLSDTAPPLDDPRPPELRRSPDARRSPDLRPLDRRASSRRQAEGPPARSRWRSRKAGPVQGGQALSSQDGLAPSSNGQAPWRHESSPGSRSSNGTVSMASPGLAADGLDSLGLGPNGLDSPALASVELDSPARDRSELRGISPRPDGQERRSRPPATSLTSQPVLQDRRVQMARRRRSRQWAQSRRTVRHLNVWTVAKVSLMFYLMILVAVVVASVMLWYFADAVGAIQSIEKSVRTLFDLSKFTLHPGAVATYTSIAGAILAVAGTIANVLIALMYNLISDVVGGIRFDVVEDAN